ncbi:ABC transporter ATP-binding protein [Peterkaempfera bronchialis]|uniref:ABC transporter ATP-binding protein n=1 Tax=Peterkaempfera bronchialis TaxID=2126346 RepID=A0A345SRF1_9ACTN|nr:ABC transporter ATP-binding protein [Peterkaempfera bronchialis]AXI76306.1 ABC transporter ATP-binding protein [Peterkaempfera bronchialis]
MTTPFVAVDGLTIAYGDAVAVDGISFDLDQGECLAILGPNGAGKSSVAKAFAGLVKPAGGSLVVDGTDLADRRPDQIARSRIAYLPEGRGIFPGLTVAENVALGMRVLPSGERAAAEAQAYELFPVLGRRRKQTAATMSGGEQQMLAVARALMTKPKLLVADEVSLGLAPMVIDAIYEAWASVRSTGLTMIVIEQYVEKALDFADRALVLRRGRVLWTGAADGAADHIVHGYLGNDLAPQA